VADRVVLEVFRWRPGRRPQLERFELPRRTTVLDLLVAAREEDGSLAVRMGCGQGICGACAVLVDGRFALACRERVGRRRRLTVLPLPRLPMIADLVVDLGPFWRAHREIRPYLVPGSQAGQSPAERRRVAGAAGCCLCGSCFVACPAHWKGSFGLGPAALGQLYRFWADSRDRDGSGRLRRAARPDGVWRCHASFTCSEVCPQGVDPARQLELLRRAVLRELIPARRDGRH